MAAKELLERPTLIYVTPSGRRLFLGLLPMANSRHLFGPITMQITCMGKSPEQRGGITLPGAHLFQFELVNAATRDGHWNELFGVLQQTLRNGEGALVHCMAGRHRAADCGSHHQGIASEVQLGSGRAGDPGYSSGGMLETLAPEQRPGSLGSLDSRQPGASSASSHSCEVRGGRCIAPPPGRGNQYHLVHSQAERRQGSQAAQSARDQRIGEPWVQPKQ